MSSRHARHSNKHIASTAHVATLRMRRPALLWIGVVCSTWVWVSRYTTDRCRLNILGDPRSVNVRDGNLLAARTAVLAFLAASLGHTFIIEQPQTSFIAYHPRMQWLLSLVKTWNVKGIHMGSYGGRPPYISDINVCMLCPAIISPLTSSMSGC
jgi:hypothetical protein